MIGFFLKLPLGTRYVYGMNFVFVSGLILAFGAHFSPPDNKMLWLLVTAVAFVHWTFTAIYLWWEKRWYRFFFFAFSTMATSFYIGLSFRVWRAV